MSGGPEYVPPQEWLSRAAEGLRAFNHASQGIGHGWRYPPHSYDALASLTRLVGMLPQALSQSIRPVDATHKQGRVLIDGGGDPHAKVGELFRAHHDAVVAAEALYRAVNAMWSATGPMGLDTRGLPEFDDED